MKRIISMTLALALCAGLLAGCSGAASGSASTSTSASTGTSDSTADSSSDTANSLPDVDFSTGLSEDGFLDGIKALDYVTLPEDFNSIALPEDVTTVSDDTIQSQIDTILSDYAVPEEITDRAVEKDDTVNIDYVGSVDGVEFDGGSTNGSGTSVVAGATNYIDDFLTQIIGHKPGETFDVEVTFPDPYENNPDLAGKDAVFKTTINYIAGESIVPALTDAFVAENLNASYGWSTVESMQDGIREVYRTQQIDNYVWQHVVEDSQYSEVPQQAVDFVKLVQTGNVTLQAYQYGFTVEQFLSMTGSGATTMEEYFEQNADSLDSSAKQLMATWAIAEKAGITVSEDDIKEMAGADDLSSLDEVYGRPYLAFSTLMGLVDTFLLDNAVEA